MPRPRQNVQAILARPPRLQTLCAHPVTRATRLPWHESLRRPTAATLFSFPRHNSMRKSDMFPAVCIIAHNYRASYNLLAFSPTPAYRSILDNERPGVCTRLSTSFSFR